MSSTTESTTRTRSVAASAWWSRVGLLAPAFVVLVLVFGVPLAVMAWRAVGEPNLNLDNLSWYVMDEVQRRVLARTFMTAFKVTVVCVILGYPYAYAMTATGPRMRAVLTLLVLIPFWTSLMVRTFAWRILLQDNGPITNALSAVGLNVQLSGNNTGVVIGMSQILLPFFVMPMYAVMAGLDRRLVSASSSLGARPLTTFTRVWFPMTMPGVGAGAIIVFISSLGFYVTPALLGSPNDSLISQQIYTQVNSQLNWGHAGAMGIVLLAATLLLLVLSGIVLRWARGRGGPHEH